MKDSPWTICQSNQGVGLQHVRRYLFNQHVRTYCFLRLLSGEEDRKGDVGRGGLDGET